MTRAGSARLQSDESIQPAAGLATASAREEVSTKPAQPAPFTDDPDTAIASLRRLQGLDATWVLPGHGTPWNGGVEEALRRVTRAAEASGS